MALQGFALRKKRTNFLVPEELYAEFMAIAKLYGAKRHWTIYSAAVLLLLEQPEAEIRRLVGQVIAADVPDGSISSLIAEAKSRRGKAGAQAASLALVDPGGKVSPGTKRDRRAAKERP